MDHNEERTRRDRERQGCPPEERDDGQRRLLRRQIRVDSRISDGGGPRKPRALKKARGWGGRRILAGSEDKAIYGGVLPRRRLLRKLPRCSSRQGFFYPGPVLIKCPLCFMCPFRPY